MLRDQVWSVLEDAFKYYYRVIIIRFFNRILGGRRAWKLLFDAISFFNLSLPAVHIDAFIIFLWAFVFIQNLWELREFACLIKRQDVFFDEEL